MGIIGSWLAAVISPASTSATPITYRAKPSPADIDIAARTVFGEARGEIWASKLGVSYTIVNRANIAGLYRLKSGHDHALFGDGTLAGACMVPNQFSVWRKSDPNYKRLAHAAKQPGWEECVDAVMTAVRGREKDPTSGSTHYTAKSARPVWARGRASIVLGNHKFYRLVD
jgi:N-acetylmuramoyl-L-alanine amidase